MSNIPTTHKYVHYDREQMKQQLVSHLVYPTPSNFKQLPMHIMPIIRSSTPLPMINTLSRVLNPYLTMLSRQQTIHEYEYIGVPIMFEFHCKQLIANGTLAKRFGDHDDATLKDLYLKQLSDDKAAFDKLNAYNGANHPYTPAQIQEVLDFLKRIHEQLGDQFNVKPITDIHNSIQPFNSSTGFNGYMKQIDDQYDLSTYLVMVPDNATDEELLALYERYPEYKSSCYDWQQIKLPNGMKNYHSSYPECFEFVMCIDRKTIVNKFVSGISSYQDREYTSDKTEWSGYQSRVVSRETTHYSYDKQAATELGKYTFEQIFAIAEAEWERTPNNAYEVGRAALRALKTKEMVILRFDKKGNFIA